MKKQADSATAVVNDTFMMLINKTVADKHKVGQQIIVKVQAVSYTKGVPTLVGETVPGTRRQVMVGVESRKIKTLLDTKDDELTGLEVVEVAEKGRGVRAVRLFSMGDPVVEYVGILSNLGRCGGNTRDRARGRRSPSIFSTSTTPATISKLTPVRRLEGSGGWSMVNHSIGEANTNVKLMVVDNVPRLILFASWDIKTGEEILYDYGERDSEVRAANPWLYN